VFRAVRISGLLFVAVRVAAQTAEPEPKRPAAALALTDRARSLPSEFCADSLLRIAKTDLILDPKWKRELIEEAFRTGARAQLPLKRRGAIHTDTRQAHESWTNDLEALTLQLRAVLAMIPFDPIRARILFEEIALPELPNPECKDPLTADVDMYYTTAAKVFEKGFTPKELEKEEHLLFLERMIGTMRSPVQVGPVANMLRAVFVTPVQRAGLHSRYAVMLGSIRGSSRVFGGTGPGSLTALMVLRQDGVPLPPLATAIRGYLTNHLSGPRCTDHLAAQGKLTAAAQAFNMLIRPLGLTDVKPISVDEDTPSKIEPAYRLDEFWQSPRSKQVLEELRWLTHGNRDLPGDKRFWTLDERSTIEWTTRFYETLKLIEGWKEDEEPSREEYSAMKAHTYGTLARLAPPGKPREMAMGQWIQFLEQNYFLVENHNYWFTDVKFMLDETKATKDRENRDWILGELTRSANPIIALYADLVKMEPWQ
jgi:hypothetical protein